MTYGHRGSHERAVALAPVLEVSGRVDFRALLGVVATLLAS